MAPNLVEKHIPVDGRQNQAISFISFSQGCCCQNLNLFGNILTINFRLHTNGHFRVERNPFSVTSISGRRCAQTSTPWGPRSTGSTTWAWWRGRVPKNPCLRLRRRNSGHIFRFRQRSRIVRWKPKLWSCITTVFILQVWLIRPIYGSMQGNTDVAGMCRLQLGNQYLKNAYEVK